MNDLLKKVGIYFIENQNPSVIDIQKEFDIQSRGQVKQITNQLRSIGLLDKDNNVLLDSAAFSQKLEEFDKIFPNITISRELVAEENDKAVKTRVPGTYGENVRYMWLSKDNATEINNGKTLLTFIDLNREYKLYNKLNDVVQTMSGTELYGHYGEVNSRISNRPEKQTQKPVDEPTMPEPKKKKENLQFEQSTEKKEEIINPSISEQDKGSTVKNYFLQKAVDSAQLKIDKLTDKNAKLTAKNEKAQIKLDRAKALMQKLDVMISSNAFPAPVREAMKILYDRESMKAANLQNKIDKRSDKIKLNVNKINKHQSKINAISRVDHFIQNLKTADGRRENFVVGVMEFQKLSVTHAVDKIEKLENKINELSAELKSTRFLQERRKLTNRIYKATDKIDKLNEKIAGFGELGEKLKEFDKADDMTVNKVVDKSVDNIAKAAVENLTEFSKAPCETVVAAAGKAIDEITPQKVHVVTKSKAETQQKTSQDKAKSKGAFPMSRNQLKKSAKVIARQKSLQHKTPNKKLSHLNER